MLEASRTATVPLMPARPKSARESRLGSYAVVAPLARGGTAGVYLAEHVATGERVALKIIDPFYAEHLEVVERMLAERDISARVTHPNLLAIHLADHSAGGVPYLVMEYLDGENLGALADRGLMAADAVISIGAQTANALAALHAAGVVHCDVKPDNVFLLYQCDEIFVKVIDYGVARTIDEQRTADGTIAGTPAYMAPEQWRGDPSAKSDVYALACMLYELLVGDQPFHGTLPQLMVAHHDRRPDRISAHRRDITPALDNLIARGLAKDPSLRPTMADFAAALAEIAAGDFEQLAATG